MALGRYSREAKRSFKASDRFWDGVDQARENAPAPRLRGRRLRAAVADSFEDADFADRAEESARDLAISTLVALAKSYKRQEREPAGSLEFAPYEEREADPLEVLLDAYGEERNPAFRPALVAALAQVGAAAILQLGKEVDQSPKTVVRALITKYFNDTDGRG